MKENTERKWQEDQGGYWCDVKDWKKIEEELDPITQETNKIIDEIVKQEKSEEKKTEKEHY